MNIPDADLIARILLSDDRNAFAALVRRYQSDVRNLLRRLTNDDCALAGDLAQEVFIRVYKSLAKFKGEARFATWIYRITYNVFVSDKRSQRNHQEFDESESTKCDEQDVSVKITLQRDLEKAMHYLNENERVAILFCCQNGYSHGEAAEILQQPIGSIKTNILRGKEKLRDRLAVWREGV